MLFCHFRSRCGVRLASALLVFTVLLNPVLAQQPDDCAERGGGATCTRADLTPWRYSYCELPVLNRYQRECEALIGGAWDSTAGCEQQNPAHTDAEYRARINDYHLWQGRRCDVELANIDWAQDGDQIGTPACWVGSTEYVNGELSVQLGSIGVLEYELDDQGQCVRNEQRDHTDWVLKARSPVCPAGTAMITLDAGEVVCKRVTDSDCRGNPIGVLNGCKIETVVDVKESAGLHFSRRYESHGFGFKPVNDQPSGIPTGMGNFWRHNFSAQLTPTPSSAHTMAAIQRSNGRLWYFDKNGEQSAPKSGVRARLKLKANGDWILNTTTGGRERFDSTGRLRSRDEPGTPRQKFLWSTTQTPPNVAPGPGYLVQVAGEFGHSIDIRYNEAGLIKRVTDSSGVRNQYFWDDASRLIAVKTAGQIRYRYHYENESYPQALTGITDGQENRFSTFEYDGSGRAIASFHADTGQGPQQETRFSRNGRDVIVRTPAGQENIRFTGGVSEPRVSRRENAIAGSVWVYDYDTNQNLVGVADPENNRTTMGYNTYGQMNLLTEAPNSALERQTTFAYLAPEVSLLAQTQRSSVVAGLKKTTKRQYDSRLNKIRETHRGFASDSSAHKRVTRFFYDHLDRKTLVDGPRTDVADSLSFTWHDCTGAGKCGQLASMTDAVGNTTRYTHYDPSGRLTQMWDANELLTRYSYDEAGRPVQVSRTSSSGFSRIQSFEYDGNGNLTSQVNAVGGVESFIYDDAQLLVERRNSVGDITNYEYDRRGNVIVEKVTRSDGFVESETRHEYDAHDQLRSMTRGGVEVTGELSSLGQMRTEKNGKSDITARYNYDALGRLTTFEDVHGGVARFSYDVNDSVSLVTAANGARTRFDWDDLGNMRQEQSADRGTISINYDNAGNAIDRIDARSSHTRFSWDALNRIAGIGYDNPKLDVVVRWDQCKNGAGRICGYTDESGDTAYSYNQFGNTTDVTWRDGKNEYRTGYKWRDDDSVRSMQYPGGRKLKYARDAAGRITAMTLSIAGDSVNLTADRVTRADGKTLSQTLANNLVEQRRYDDRGRLIAHELSGLSVRNYRYDRNDNVTGWVDGSSGRDYFYSASDQLIAEAGGGGLSGDQRNYGYDANSNQIQRIDNSGSYQRTISPSSNLVVSEDQNLISNDASGNRTYDPRSALEFNWDDRGRMRRVRSGGKTVAVYAYNARGQRSSKVTKNSNRSKETQFHYDIHGRLIAESVNGKFVREYYWDDYEIVAQMNPKRGVSSLRWLIHDPASATRRAIDSQGQTTWQWEPDGFGNGVAEVSGNLADNVVNIRFDGQYVDEETGFHYNWHRYYDPVTARYLSVDPLGLAGGLNPFNYAASNPATLSDPTGLEIPLGEFGVTEGFHKACGSGEIAGKVPDGFLMYNFGPACERHDRCYETCGRTRGDCDREFLHDLKFACGVKQMVPNQACRAVARIYGFVTRHKGDQYFKAAQYESRCHECD